MMSGYNGWIRIWMSAGVNVQTRTSYHYSLYRNEVRIDFWPKKRKYHVLDTGERGVMDDSDELIKLFDKVDELVDERRSAKSFDKDESMAYLKLWYSTRGKGLELKGKYGDEYKYEMYEEDNEMFCFTLTTGAKTRPKTITLPEDVEKLVERRGNSVYLDNKEDGVVVWYTGMNIDLRFYKKKN